MVLDKLVSFTFTTYMAVFRIVETYNVIFRYDLSCTKFILMIVLMIILNFVYFHKYFFEKSSFWCLRTTKARTSLRIYAV